jgi:hypothetical protein
MREGRPRLGSGYCLSCRADPSWVLLTPPEKFSGPSGFALWHGSDVGRSLFDTRDGFAYYSRRSRASF